MNSRDNFVERPFLIVPGGEYDGNGFYNTPDGSFWDPDGVYFNREGVDKHSGYYDENLEYHPGPGWIDHLMCYEDERANVPRHKRILRNEMGDEFDEVDEIDIDELYEEVDYGKLLREEEKKLGYAPQAENPNLLSYSQDVNKNLACVNKYESLKGIFEFKTNTSHGAISTPVKPLISTTQSTSITPDLLFNKIPDSLNPTTKYVERKEKQIEVDSLFQ